MSESSKSGFDLDISGVAGFFGGDVSVSAMATVHVYEGRRWLGWYNQPGSFEIAKKYGQLARSRFWDALYPGSNVSPEDLFGYGGTEGPKFTASQSGTVLAKTTHVAHLFAKECKARPVTPIGHTLPVTRMTAPGCVTIAKLANPPPYEKIPQPEHHKASILASIPILTSLGACAGCALIRDWYCFAIILLGIISSGLSCFVIATGTLKYTRPREAVGAPDGDGVLECDTTELVILKGSEGAVNAVTRGQFTLDYGSAPEYHIIGVCSLLLTLQFISQLLLIPQSSLHGQLFFLATLLCSWAYNSYLSSLDREKIQRAILRDKVLMFDPKGFEKYQLGTRTAMVTFALLLLAPAKKYALERVLNDLLPNNTSEWRSWKEGVLHCIEVAFKDVTKAEDCPMDFDFDFGSSVAGPENEFPRTLYTDAKEAADMYKAYRKRSSESQASTVLARPSPVSFHEGKSYTSGVTTNTLPELELGSMDINMPRTR